jgi:hypothetical protein
MADAETPFFVPRSVDVLHIAGFILGCCGDGIRVARF